MMEQQLYELPEGWERSSLGDIPYLEIIMGQSPPSSTYNSQGNGLPFYQGKKEFGVEFPTPSVFCTEPKKIAEKGDILLSVRAPVGPTNFCAETSCIGRGLAAIRAAEDILDPKFLRYYFLNFEKYIIEKGQGSTFSAISKKDIIALEIPLPLINEQKRIVAKLDALFTRIDTAISHLQETLELSKALFASETSRVFDQISNKYGSANLSKLVQINSGIALPKIFKDWKLSGSIPFYKVAQMNNDDRVMKDALITFNPDVALTHRIKLFPKGSVLIPTRGGAILTEKKRILLEDASYDSNIMGLKADDKNITDEYLFRFMLSVNLSDYVDTSSIPQINNKHIDQMQIPLAPIEEQRHIVAHLDALAERTRTLEAATQEKLDDLTALKASLLDVAFRGQL